MLIVRLIECFTILRQLSRPQTRLKPRGCPAKSVDRSSFTILDRSSVPQSVKSFTILDRSSVPEFVKSFTILDRSSVPQSVKSFTILDRSSVPESVKSVAMQSDHVHYEMPWWRCHLIMWIILILGWARHSVPLPFLACAMERRTSENGFKDDKSVNPLNPCSYPALMGTLLSARNQTSQLSES